MTLLDQLEALIEQSHAEGRKPLHIQVMPEKVAEVDLPRSSTRPCKIL